MEFDPNARNVIYLATCSVNGKQYVGQTRNRVGTRWRQHIGAATRPPRRSPPIIENAMRAHGIENFSISLLEVAAADDLNEREAYWIALLGTVSPYGYNLTAGGNSAARSAETRQRMSIARAGKPLSEAHIAKLKIVHQGQKQSPETIEKRAAALRGRPRPPEVRAKIQLGHLGKTRSEEARRNQSLAQTGKKRGPHSPEHAAKIGAAQRGRPLTPEHYQRVVEANRRIGQLRRAALPPKVCEQCGISFERPKTCSRTAWARRRFCGPTCQHNAVRGKTKKGQG